MEWWLVPAVVIATLASAGMLALGWHDGWIGFSRLARGRAAQSRIARRFNLVGVAEVVRFPALRRRIGHEPADRIMTKLAERASAADSLTLCRLGRCEIEFACALDNPLDASAALARLKHDLEQQLSVGSFDFQPEIAIGACAVEDGQPHERYFDHALLALERARGEIGLVWIESDVGRPGREDSAAELLDDLRRAIDGDALELHYMPKLRLAQERIDGAEALCRWTHPGLGAIPAAEFVRLAEETGLILDLTIWVLDRALSDQRRLAEREAIDLDIHINVSAQLIGNESFCDAFIARTAHAAGRIGIEITETAVIQDSANALANLERLRAAGVHVAIDDFGAGLASLAYLRDLPADELKIDQMFVRELTTNHRDPLLVRSAIDIAHALEMEVTAEGVEDEIALALLKVMRCDQVQGYHFSPPLPFADLVTFLRARPEMLRDAPAVAGKSQADALRRAG